MVVNGHAVVAENVDLLLHLLAALQQCLHLVDLLGPVGRYALCYILLKLGIFDVFRVGIDGVYGGVAFAVGAVLLERIEAARGFLGAFCHGLFEVTAGGRYCSYECDGTLVAVVQIDIPRAAVECADDSGEVHGEGVLSGQFLKAVTHLAQRLCPA